MNDEDVDGMIQRKQTKLDLKRPLQNFIQPVHLLHKGSINVDIKSSQCSEEIKKEDSLPNLKTNLKATEVPTMLSFIYDDKTTQRMKNIEEMGAPLTQLDRILQTILVELRTNLSEPDHPLNVIVSRFQGIICENVMKIQHKFKFNYPLIIGRTTSKPMVIDINDTSNMVDEEKRGYDLDVSHNKHQLRQTAMHKRDTYNRQTLDQLPQEAKFAEVVIAEVKKLVCMLYGTLIRFYVPVMSYTDLHDMREDLIEMITSLTVRGELGRIILQLCRIGTRDNEAMLSARFQELKSIKPELIGVDRFFTLNDTSKLLDIFSEQEEANKKVVDYGDIGGSIFAFEDKPEKITRRTASFNTYEVKEEYSS